MFVFSLVVASLWASPTLETMKKEFRVAIVIGNSSYDENPLPTSTENARKMRAFLEKNGFYVYYGENLDKRNYIRLLRKFNKKMRPGGIGLFYFSGHVVQTKGRNYLIPVDNGIENEEMILRQGINLKSVYSGMEMAHNRLNIVIVDGAKEAPFGSLFTMEKPAYAPIKTAPGFATFMASHPNSINTSDTFTQDFLTLADKQGLDIGKLRGELSYLRQLHKQPQPQITLANEEPFYFNLPDKLPKEKLQNHAKVKTAKPVKETDTQIDKQKVQDKQQTAESEQAEQAEAKLTEHSEVETNVQKNDVNITLSAPGSVIQEVPKKPEEGEKRQILLQ
jgi:hypothetical protein